MRTTFEAETEKQVPQGRNDNAREGIPPALSPLSRLQAGRNDKREKSGSGAAWAQVCATAGAAVWAGMAVLARMGIARIGAIELLFLFAPLVIAPLGMELGRVIGEGGRLGEMAWRLQPLGAICAVLAMLMTPGLKAGLVGLGWMLVCALMAVNGLFDLMALRKKSPLLAPKDAATNGAPGAIVVGITLAVAKVDLAVGGAWLVASRLGMRPMGIQEPIGLLTAVHFHYAGFATATIAAATLRFQESLPALSPDTPEKWGTRLVPKSGAGRGGTAFCCGGGVCDFSGVEDAGCDRVLDLRCRAGGVAAGLRTAGGRWNGAGAAASGGRSGFCGDDVCGSVCCRGLSGKRCVADSADGEDARVAKLGGILFVGVDGVAGGEYGAGSVESSP